MPRKRLVRAESEDENADPNTEDTNHNPRRKRAERDDGEEEAKFKPKRRELVPVEQIGFYRTSKWTLFNNLRRVTEYGQQGPFNDSAFAKWWRDRDKQFDFMQRFWAPMHFDMPLRQLPHDIVTEHALCFDASYTERTINAIQTCEGSTKLDVPCNKLVQSAFFPQFPAGRRGQAISDNGPDGGRRGCCNIRLWIFSANNIRECNESIQFVLNCIGQGLKAGSKFDKFAPAISTEFTEVQSQKPNIQSGIVVADQRSLDELHKVSPCNASYDIDAYLLRKIAVYRSMQDKSKFSFRDSVDGISGAYEPDLPGAYDNPIIIPTCAALNDCSANPNRCDQYCDNSKLTPLAQMFDLVYHTEIMHGKTLVKGKAQSAAIRFDCIELKAKVPAVEPICALRDMCAFIEDMNKYIELIVLHMKITLGLQMQMHADHWAALPYVGTDAHIPLAFFLFAASHEIRNVHFTGMRINTQDPQDMQAYREYLGHIENNRQKHFITCQSVILQDTQKGFGKQHMQPLAGFKLDFMPGISYRKFSSEYLNTVKLGEDDMSRLPLTFDENEDAFIVVGRAFENNSGVRVHMDIDAHEPWVKIRTCTSRGSLDEQQQQVVLERKKSMQDPSKATPAIIVWNATQSQKLGDGKQAGVDCMQAFWDKDDVIPTLDYLHGNRDQLPPGLDSLLLAADQRVSVISPMIFEHSLYREHRLLRLYGNVPSNLSRSLANAARAVSTKQLHRQLYQTFTLNLDDCKNLMITGELHQWKMAARVISVLDKHGTIYGRQFVADWENIQKVIANEPPSVVASFADESALASFLCVYGFEQIDTKLHWQNLQNVDALICSMIGMNAKLELAYGGTLLLKDCAGAINIKTKKGSKLAFNIKTPGSGCDVCIILANQSMLVYGKYGFDEQDIQTFYDSRANHEKIIRYVTQLGAQFMLGCGLKVVEGRIVLNGDYAAEAGLFAFFSDQNKVNAGTVSGQGQLPTLENSMAHSGSSWGTDDRPWISTQDQKQTGVRQVLGCRALLWASNIMGTEPASLVKGGRGRDIASGVRDGDAGTLKTSLESTTVLKVDTDLKAEDSDNDDSTADEIHKSKKRRSQAQADLVLKHLTPSARANLRAMSKNDVQRMRSVTFELFMQRFVLMYLQRTMHAEPSPMWYTFTTENAQINSSMRAVTEGLRREVARDEEVFSRCFDGPYLAMSVWPKYVRDTSTRLIAKVSRLYKIDDDEVSVDLYKVVESFMASVVFVPINLYPKLTGAHTWLTGCVLDPGIMILCCHSLAMLNFDAYCPIEVLALAATHHCDLTTANCPLNPKQIHQYKRFCQWLLEIMSKTGTAGDRRLKGKLVRDTCLQDVSMETLDTWWDKNYPSENAACKEVRQNGAVTRYVRPTLGFVALQRPSWLQPLEWKTGRPAANYIRDYRMAVMQMYADGQSDEGDTRRQSICGVDRKGVSKIRQHERANVFWKAAQAGTRLPGKSVDESADSTKAQQADYNAVWESEHFFADILRLTGNANGPICHFAILCGATMSNTRKDLLAAILEPYLKTDDEARTRFEKISDCLDWTKPVFGDTTPVYDFGALPLVMPMPGVNDRTQHGVEVFLGTDILWLVVGQALFAAEWERNCDSTSKSVTHLRNMAHCSQTLLSMLLHTKIDRSVIPYNTGKLLLNARSPMLCKSEIICANINFDERLHVSASSAQSSGMLSSLFRMPDNFEFESIESSDFLFYKNIRAALSFEAFINAADIPLWPPESVAHMQSHFKMFSSAVKSICLHCDAVAYARQGTFSNIYPIAALLYGTSVTEESIFHIPVTLTYCVASACQEIPCMTLHGSHIFTVVLSGNVCTITPTLYTHEVISGMLFQYNLPRLSALPCNPERAHISFPITELSDVMSSRLRIGDDGAYLARTGGADSVPCAFFPVVKWPVLIGLTHKDKLIEGSFNDKRHQFRLVEVDRLWNFMMNNDMLHSQEDTTKWLCMQDDIFQNIDSAYELFMSKTKEPVFWMSSKPDTDDDEDSTDTHFFINRAHLKHALLQNNGRPCSDDEEESWAYPKYLCLADAEGPLRDTETYSLHKMRLDPLAETEEIQCIVNTYSDDEYTALCMQLQKCEVALDTQVRKNKNVGKTFAPAHVNTEPLQQKITEVRHALQACRVKVTRCGVIDLDFGTTEDMAFPCSPGEEIATWGLVLPQNWPDSDNDDSSQLYMKDGHYQAFYFENTPNTSRKKIVLNDDFMKVIHLDFMHMSLCMLREGEPVFVDINAVTCQLLAKNNMRIGDEQLNNRVERNETPVQLRAFYILSDKLPVALYKAKIRLCVRVECLVKFDVTEISNRMLDFPLFDDYCAPMIHSTSHPDYEQITILRDQPKH